MRHLPLAAALGVAFATGPALALDADEISVLAGPCASCHGPDGDSPSTIPSIAGHDYQELQSRMLAFKAGEVSSATVMPRHMRGYSDEQIDALAAYFSEIE